MSCKLHINSIKPKLLAHIKHQLHLVPHENFFQKKTKEWKVKHGRADESDKDGTQPIDFYYQDQHHIYLPVVYASSYFQSNFNINIPYPKHSWKFTGDLLERQVSVATDAWDIMHKTGAVILGLYPGFGKTVLASHLSAKAGLLTCVMICLDALIVQWVTTFRNFTNAQIWVVGDPMPDKFDVMICMDRRWIHIPDHVRAQVGTLVIDEAHMFCSPVRSTCFMAFQPLYVIPLTATIEREDGMEQIIYASAGSKGIFRESIKPFQVFKVNTNIRPEKKLNKMGWTDYMALQKEVAVHPRRNGIIVDLVKRNLNFKILILTTLREHSEILYAALLNHNVNVDFLIGGKRSYSDSNVLVGTMGKLGTGFDAATACPDYQGRPFDLLIVAATIKQIKMLTQNIGRVFRSDFPTVFHLVDDDKIYQRHWSGAEKWYNNRSGTVSEIFIPPLMPVPEINAIIPTEAKTTTKNTSPHQQAASSFQYQQSASSSQYQQPASSFQYQQPSSSFQHQQPGMSYVQYQQPGTSSSSYQQQASSSNYQQPAASSFNYQQADSSFRYQLPGTTAPLRQQHPQQQPIIDNINQQAVGIAPPHPDSSTVWNPHQPTTHNGNTSFFNFR